MGLLAAAAPGAVQGATLVVAVDGVAPGRGDLRLAVCATSFDEAGCPLGASHPAQAGSTQFAFRGLVEGRYAVAVYQDLDGDGRLGTMLGGLPTEPYGFSNDIGRWRPPSFEDALVEVGPGETVVHVRLGGLFGLASGPQADGGSAFPAEGAR